ncbi:YbaB/EbfC family nucleoid-associated protein [Nonomuraea sp. 3N208]|uniref:YbaB/EbfC family nucleoid-associated protein n=1 Tax=Nonomuraea sp. 3N208 TaxID=3457421 RepID=UPI003FCC44FD
MFGPRRNPAAYSDAELAREAALADRALAWIERAQAEIAAVKGVGESRSGQVVATVTADGKVLGVSIKERAMRLDSRTLAEEVLAALRQAGLDAARQADELIREGMPGYDPAAVSAQLERLANTPWE